jgi:hypothetical protein
MCIFFQKKRHPTKTEGTGAAVTLIKNLTRSIGLLTAIFSYSAALSAEVFPGLSPDCWQDVRAYHGLPDSNFDYRKHFSVSKQQKLRVDTAAASSEAFDNLSPNNGYSFNVSVKRPSAVIKIDSEKSYILIVNFNNIFGLSDAKWINENIVYVRMFLGRELFFDILYHVESEIVIHSQQGRQSDQIINQYRESCNNTEGCNCAQIIKK